MNAAEFTEWITCKVNCKRKKLRKSHNYISKASPFENTFKLNLKEYNHVSNPATG